MQRAHFLGASRRRAKQDARDSHMLKGPSERRDAIRVREHGLDAGALELLDSALVTGGAPDRMAAGGKRHPELCSAAAASDDQAARQARDVG